MDAKADQSLNWAEDIIMSWVTRKQVFRVSDQVRHKPGCTTTEDHFRLEILDFGSRWIVLSLRRNKGTDQLPCYRPPDLRLCFYICKKLDFLMTWLLYTIGAVASTEVKQRLQDFVLSKKQREAAVRNSPPQFRHWYVQ